MNQKNSAAKHNFFSNSVKAVRHNPLDTFPLKKENRPTLKSLEQFYHILFQGT
jgi:hypothetical protein